MFDAEMNEDSAYADRVDMDSGSSGGGGGRGFAGITGYIAHGFGNSISYYGAWYEGEQQNAYYNAKAALTWQEKQKFIRKSEQAIAEVRSEARDAWNEAGYIERIGEIKEKKYKEQTDSGIADLMIMGAKSGVDMSFGSPLEVMGKAIDDRAQDFGLMKWENEYDVYKRQKRAANISDKATIMLSESNMEQQMFDYQASMFGRAAGDARRAARYKAYQAGLNVG